MSRSSLDNSRITGWINHMTLKKREKKRIHRVKGFLLPKREKLEENHIPSRQKMAKLPLKNLLFTPFSLFALLVTYLNQANPHFMSN